MGSRFWRDHKGYCCSYPAASNESISFPIITLLLRCTTRVTRSIAPETFLVSGKTQSREVGDLGGTHQIIGPSNERVKELLTEDVERAVESYQTNPRGSWPRAASSIRQ